MKTSSPVLENSICFKNKKHYNYVKNRKADFVTENKNSGRGTECAHLKNIELGLFVPDLFYKMFNTIATA